MLALLFAPFAMLACWSLIQAWRTRKISSRGWTFQADKSPVGFWLVAVCDFSILAFGLALALHAFGLIGDHLVPVRIVLPHLY